MMSLDEQRLPSPLVHGQEADYSPPVAPHTRLPTATYAAALDHLVIGCVDLVFTYQAQMLLAQRCTHPRCTWWIVGGRMQAGEAPVVTARRKAEQEAGLKITDADRFQYVGTFSTVFAQRAQPPQAHGLHSLNVTYQIDVTATEKAELQLCPSEYADWQWLTLAEVRQTFPMPAEMDRLLLAILEQVSMSLRP